MKAWPKLPVLSAMKPAIHGSTAPPTIATQSNPDVAELDADERWKVSEKIVGNMIELNSPTPSAQYAAAGPVSVNAASESSPAIATMITSRIGADTTVSSALPTKRPTSAPPQ